MKKLPSLCLIFVLVLSFSACGTNKAVKEDIPAPKGGTATDTEYKNEELGLGFSLPDGWYFYSRDEIDSLFKNVSGNDGREFEFLCDVFASSKDRSSNINIIIEKKNDATYGLGLATLVKNSADMIKKEFSAVYDKVDMSLETYKVGDTEYPGYKVTTEYEGHKLYQFAFMTDMQNYTSTVSITLDNEDGIDDIMAKFFEA